MASFDPEARRSLCMLIAQQRLAGLPDVMIAAGLGVSVEKLREDCPDDGITGGFPPPRGTHRDPDAWGNSLKPDDDPITHYDPQHPSRSGTHPHRSTALPAPSDDGSGLAVLLLLMLLAS